MCSTLDICSFNWCCCWCYWSHSWCVGCWSFCSVLIFTDNCHSWCSSYKVWFWNECYCSICCNCKFTNTFNSLSCWTIVKCCWNIFVDWNSLFNTVNFNCTTLEFRLTCLSCTLDVFCFCWCCGWCYSYYSWCVLSCSSLNVLFLNLTVFISSNWRWQCNFHTFGCTSKAWFWSEGYFTSCRINSVSPFSCYCYRCRISSKTCCWIYQLSRIVRAWSNNNLITSWVRSCCIKGRCFFLSCTLNIFRCFVNPFDFNRSNCWDVKTIHGIQLTINVCFLVWEFCWPTSIITIIIWTTDRDTISCS